MGTYYKEVLMKSLEYDKAYMDYQIKLMELHEIQIKRKSKLRTIIGILLSIVVFFMIYMLFVTEVPAGNREVIYLLVGNATGAFFGTLINFYFGDSEGRMENSQSPPSSSPQSKSEIQESEYEK
jgi:hypothetical protein